jgi:hypothetical protein
LKNIENFLQNHNEKEIENPFRHSLKSHSNAANNTAPGTGMLEDHQ